MLHILAEEGVDRVFGNPGTTELPLLDALNSADGVEYVLGLQEGSVVAMADGYARATGRPAVVSLHAACGTANGVSGLLNARRSRTPLVVLAGQQDRRHLLQDPMLSGDLAALARPAVKEAHEVRHAADLPLLLRRAFDTARRAPAGPVFLSIPMDVLAERTPVEVPARSRVAPQGPADAEATAEAARLLTGALSPVIVAGDGVGREGAVAELVAVAEALGATVLHQPLHDGVDFPYTHPLHAGMLPATHAGVREALEGHDVVLIVGTHAFTPHHYTPDHPIPDGSVVVQLDSDGAEIGRNFPAAVGLTGAVRPSLAALSAELTRGGPVEGAERRAAEAAERAAGRAAEWERTVAAHRADRPSAPLSPLAAVDAVARALPPDAVVVEEAITSGVLLRGALRLERPGGYVHTVGGGLGHGIGAAVGTRLGGQDRPVVAVLGDGCTMFGLQGLWSAARLGLAVTFVVLNNGEYRILKDTLDSWSSESTARGSYPGLDLAPPHLDFQAAARTFGVPATRVKTLEELSEAVGACGSAVGPRLIEVPIAGHEPRAGAGTDS
ncbi:thiamine pyrophosphate-binding protein [Streptomyces tsukubensis]|uniref:Thiamine pyrophosphate-binding protein n=1 Tax=Streptomyces tsukubensis TaxID=83656 RepID=A0A1V4AEK4_9ACTN|nr:thiamine pyrophosphate-binding protein [Streptomyces tsukubensis]